LQEPSFNSRRPPKLANIVETKGVQTTTLNSLTHKHILKHDKIEAPKEIQSKKLNT
jgi:hypothetical protein